jgi:alpha-glucosidase
MLHLRRGHESLRTGDTVFQSTDEPILSFVRGGEFLCVFNLSADRHQVDCAGGTMVLGEGASLDSGSVQLSGNGFAILHL